MRAISLWFRSVLYTIYRVSYTSNIVMTDRTLTPRRVGTYQTVRDLILKGELAAGARIIESAVCEQLGVSRTPMREALFRLEQEGLVRQDAAKGFSVMPLTAREVREIYPIIWTLEVLALKLCEGNRDLDKLRDANRRLNESATAEARHESDDEWHCALVDGCRNVRLLRQIDVLKQAAHRYELAYMRHCGKVGASVTHHTEIVEALEQNDINKAVLLLEEHWRFGMNTLLDWLDWQGEPK